jgi:hypothetical protein
MKWIENGTRFEGSVKEYLDLHKGHVPVRRTRRGKEVSVVNTDDTVVTLKSLRDAAQYITNQTGRYCSPATLSKMNRTHFLVSDFTDHTDPLPLGSTQAESSAATIKEAVNA